MTFQPIHIRNFKIICGILLFVILIYNFKVSNSLKYEANGDAFDYIHLATSLGKTGVYGHTSFNRGELLELFKTNKIEHLKVNEAKPTAFRPPVWPFLIAGIFILFGYNLTYILIFKFLLHLLGIFIFYKTLKILKLKEVLILFGCFLYAIHPAWQLYSRVFLSESITFFFMSLWVYLLVRYIQEKEVFFIQSLVAGIMILSHPYYLFLPFSIWFVLFIYKQFSLKKLFISTIICISVVSIWFIRNYMVLDANQVVLTTSSGAVMAKGWNKDVPRLHTNTKGDLADETLVLKNYSFNEKKSRNEVARMNLYKDATLDFIKTNPDLILPIIGKKLMSAFNPFPETARPGFLETGRVIFQVLALFTLIFYVFFSKNKYLRSFAIALVFSTIAISVVTYSGFRFRMPQASLELLLMLAMLGEIFPALKTKLQKGGQL
ncbi:glycosyltransferase family 39 protein [uncultured Salegentibacter sp.]|uniref:ArnT family glycosyltransferase n=1 Tax=uncultured Salegentibacter sp. TaxID=259320 RepID=UPI002597307A|nr:glycosyltransferase family 39 protein [uncultured Salegentibacter sp.]